MSDVIEQIGKITDRICGRYPEAGVLSTQQEMLRQTCMSLVTHYIGMTTNDPYGQAWAQANAGHANVYNAVLQARRISQAAGSSALDFLDIEALAARVKHECRSAGFTARG